jgi:acetyltransferase-like isoleucine patch superfamily enzyme
MIKRILRKLIYREKSSGEKYIAYCKRGGATIGNNVTVYSAKNTTIDETSLQHIFIGDNTQITAGVIILAHDYSYSVLGNIYGELPRQQKDTIIGKNVFIGMNSIILMGSNIGDNVIIGAGSVVSGHIPSNTVCAGNPAKIICSLDQFLVKGRTRFEESARCYYAGIKRKKQDVTEEDMIIYRSLFAEKSEMERYIAYGKFRGVENEKIINMENYRKYKTFNDFMEDIQ